MRKLRLSGRNFKVIGAATTAVVVGFVGVSLLRGSQAATPSISVEAEAGSVATPAMLASDSQASGGRAVKFQAGGAAGVLCAGYSNWSDSATWGGAVPAANAVVTLPAGKKIRLDVDAPHLNGLTIPAGTELCFPQRATTFSAKYIAVNGGKLTMGTEETPLTSDVTLKLEGGVNGTDDFVVNGQAASALAAYNSTYGSALKPNMGTNVLIAYNGGVVDMFGEKRGTTWVQLASPSAAGATTLKLNTATSWRAGDRIVISSATFDPLAYDDTTISAVSADGKTLTLAKPLKYRHAGSRTCLTTGGESRCVEERSEVGLLSHSIKVTGPADAPSTRFGGQTVVLNGGIMRIDNIQMYAMGQEGILGRYPLHFHIAGDGGANSFVRDVSLHNNFNRQITIHGTNKLQVSGMVANDSFGHSVMLENGYEERNVFTRNLVMTTRYEPNASKRLLFTDKVPSAYWITNGNNDLIGNSAAGSEGAGFWFDPTGFGTNDVIGASYADRRPFAKFDDNIAHSVVRPVGRDEFTNSHMGGTGIITESPYSMSNRTGRGTAHNNTIWMNASGMWIDGGYDFVDTKAANNGMSIAASFGAVRGGLIYIVGTGNTVASEIGPKDTFAGWRFYHGAGDIDDMWIGGLDTPYNVYGNDDNSASAGDADNRIRKIRYFGAGHPTYPTNYRTMLCFNFVWCTNPESSHWIIDMDGSVLGTGNPSTPTGQPLYLYKNQPLQQNAAQDKTLYKDIKFIWDGPVTADLTRCRPLAVKDEGTMRLRFGVEDSDAVKLTRDDGISDVAFLPALLNGRTYSLQPKSGGSFSSLSFDWSGSPPSLVKMVIPWGKSTAPVARDGYACAGSNRPMAGSMSSIASSGGWYYDSGAKKKYMSHCNRQGRCRQWATVATGKAVTTIGALGKTD